MITKELVIEALKRVEDPEMFLDIWFLGLIYGIEIEESLVKVEMTFTSPMCPAGPQLINEVEEQVGKIEGVAEVEVTVVFVPPWEPNEEIKALMGYV